MYNMEINIFGFKIRLEILLLIIVAYFVISGHLFCSCCKLGFENNNGVDKPAELGFVESEPGFVESESEPISGELKLISGNIEGFTPANTNFGESSNYTLTDNIDTDKWGSSEMSVNGVKWGQPSLVVQANKPLSDAVKNILNRDPQPIPPPEGELDFLSSTPFKPECCPNAYSNSVGCACMTGDQYNYLILRGGNNVPYSEY